MSDKQARNWIANTSLPIDTITIERVLFGRDQNYLVTWRMELRDALKRTRSGNATTGAARTHPQLEQLIDYGRLPETFYQRLVGRDAELERLDNAWLDSQINIASLIAEGGAGKSAVVNEWLNRLQADNYRGAETVLAWSFYSQGTKESATSAEEFLNWAVAKLGITLATTSASAKAEAIAKAIKSRRALLLLDGVEPLQHGPGPQLGELKDFGLRALLRSFATTPPKAGHGLVVLTSRLAVKDIARWQNGAAPVVRVERLSDEAGASLLRENGVWGVDKDLKDAVHDFSGHPLALGLLASYLKETQTGDVRRRDHIRNVLADAENPGHDHAKRVMESYESKWLANQPVLLSIMHIVGLFDRPISEGCLRALCKKPAIKGLTDEIVKLSDVEWQRAVSRLREAHLLAPADHLASNALDAHPLLREWFGARLRAEKVNTWRAAHFVIYDYLRRTTREGDTPTIEQLAPLYQAVAHGCQANLHREVLHRIYINRLCRWRPDKQLKFYSKHFLGAFGADLAALSWFFKQPYDTPLETIDEHERLWIFGEVGWCLTAQGRFREALQVMQTSLPKLENRKEWHNACIRAANVSDVELLMGNIDNAIQMGLRSVSNAEKSDDDFNRVRTSNFGYFIASRRLTLDTERIDDEAAIEIDAEISKIEPLQLQHLGQQITCSLLCARSFHRGISPERPSGVPLLYSVTLRKEARSLLAYLPADAFWTMLTRLESGKLSQLEASYQKPSRGYGELTSLHFL